MMKNASIAELSEQSIALIDPKVLHIITTLGIKLKDCSTKDRASWDGETLTVYGRAFKRTKSVYEDEFSNEDLVHEIAHWFVSPVGWRRFVNFGLGASPREQWDSKIKSHNLRYWNGDKEESIASALDIAIQCRINLDYKQALSEQNWDSIQNVVEVLHNEGIWIDRKGVPFRRKKSERPLTFRYPYE